MGGVVATALVNGTAQNYSASEKEDKTMSPAVGYSMLGTSAPSCDSVKVVDLSTVAPNE